MNITGIEWARNPDGSQGYTWNPITGCLNHDNGLCKGGDFPCYACKLARGRLKEHYTENHNVRCGDLLPNQTGIEELDKRFADPFYPRFWEERLYEPFFRQKPSGIFVCDMSDLFGNSIPHGWTSDVVEEIIPHSPQHRFYLLTKQAQNLPQFSPFPENCWVGVTATNQRAFNIAIGNLAQIKASIRFISFEPLLDSCQHPTLPYLEIVFKEGNIDWLIPGACTGTKRNMEELCKRYPELTLMPWGKKWTAQPPIEWLREIVKAADKARVKVFLKNNLLPLFEAEGITKREDWTGIRQEMPR